METCYSCNAVLAYKKYNVFPSYVREFTLKAKYIPQSLQYCFSLYKLAKWNASHLLAKLENAGGNLIAFGKSYRVIWITPRGEFIHPDMLSDTSHLNCVLSFREAQEEFGIPPVVLVWKPFKLFYEISKCEETK